VNRAMRYQHGLSLIELMIASAIGLLLLTGLTMIFVNSSEANRELQKTAQQIENGRYAIDLLANDLRLAGFYGHFYDIEAIPAPATVPPDPCATASAVELRKTLWYPVQGYAGTIDSVAPASDTAPNVSSTTCAALSAANLKKGSDVLVIRRADTNALAPTAAAASGVYYLQASATEAEIQAGTGAVVGTTKKADGVTTATIYLSNGAVTPPAAPIRKFRVHVYFVAPCSVGNGAGGVCNGSAGEDTIPTLKRLEMGSGGAFTIVPLVEGIDYLKVEYGIDDSPSTVNLATGYSGDSNVDRYEPTPTGAEWTSVIGARIYVLARNTESTRGYVDDKTYKLGSIDVPQRNDNFKRHVYSAAVRMTNPAGRREIP